VYCETREQHSQDEREKTGYWLYERPVAAFVPARSAFLVAAKRHIVCEKGTFGIDTIFQSRLERHGQPADPSLTFLLMTMTRTITVERVAPS